MAEKWKVRIFFVGKTKERYIAEGIAHYLKLLRNMARVSIIEIKEEKGKNREQALLVEGRRILKQTGAYVLLSEMGKEFNSEGFARFLSAKSNIDFVVGGPYGVSDDVKEKAANTIALSKMTLPHEMARLIFLEQIYRAMTIIEGKDYHY